MWEVACASAKNPDLIQYTLEYTDPNGANPVQIGSTTGSYWRPVCNGTSQPYTMSIAPSHGQVLLVNKRLRLTATLVHGSGSGSPTLYLGSSTYLSTPPYYVCGGGTNGGGNGGNSGSKGGKPSNPNSPNSINTLIYQSSDHLGSVSLTTNSYGQSAGVQEFDPWGKVRSGGTVGTQTRMNYTGQKLDDTGLLYYHARMYDPGVGRFVSPDSIVPGTVKGSGAMSASVGRERNSYLTVSFNELSLLDPLNQDNARVVSGTTGTGTHTSSGPDNPQALSRYSYVLNNPVHYVDPTGHQSAEDGERIGGPKLSAVDMIRWSNYNTEMQKSAGGRLENLHSRGLALRTIAVARLYTTFSGAAAAVFRLISNQGEKAWERLQSIFDQHKDMFGEGCFQGSFAQNASTFKEGIARILSSPASQMIPGTFTDKAGTVLNGFHFWNPSTNEWAFFLADGRLWTAWQLGPQQATYLMATGNVK